MRWLIPLALVCVGCESLEYRGWSPSVRTMQEYPNSNQVYVGADANFAIIDPSEARRTTRAAESGRDPLDIWNPPIVWDKTPSISTATETANTSNQPAFGN